MDGWVAVVIDGELVHVEIVQDWNMQAAEMVCARMKCVSRSKSVQWLAWCTQKLVSLWLLQYLGFATSLHHGHYGTTTTQEGDLFSSGVVEVGADKNWNLVGASHIPITVVCLIYRLI